MYIVRCRPKTNVRSWEISAHCERGADCNFEFPNMISFKRDSIESLMIVKRNEKHFLTKQKANNN